MANIILSFIIVRIVRNSQCTVRRVERERERVSFIKTVYVYRSVLSTVYYSVYIRGKYSSDISGINSPKIKFLTKIFQGKC